MKNLFNSVDTYIDIKALKQFKSYVKLPGVSTSQIFILSKLLSVLNFMHIVTTLSYMNCFEMGFVNFGKKVSGFNY